MTRRSATPLTKDDFSLLGRVAAQTCRGEFSPERKIMLLSEQGSGSG